MLITDAQAHVGDRLRCSYPQFGVEAGDRLSGQILMQLMDEAGIDRTVLVPVTGPGDNDESLAASREFPERLAVMGIVGFDRRQSIDEFDSWITREGLLGIRVNFLAEERKGWLSDGSLDWLWEACQANHRSIMVFAPGRARAIGEIARQFPDLQLIIDHLNLGRDVRNEQIAGEVDPLYELVKDRNVSLKVSSLAYYVDGNFAIEKLFPVIRRIVEEFGPNRCMWGSDLTKLRCTYADWLDASRAAVAFLSPNEQEEFFGGTLSRLLGWEQVR